ncbi:MAG: OmpA family protein [Flavobacteriaceae bacterium]|nr:OmpA family protein [Flavobacteriaceae bacterium]
MKRLIYSLFFFSCFAFSQNEINHVVYFETDKYVVPETEQSRLLLFIMKLQEAEVKKISIYGFCDDRGTNLYNETLSQNRADAIKSILSHNNIKESIISNVDGKGEILLKIVNTVDINIIRGLNRKVEIIAIINTKNQPKKELNETPKEPSTVSVLKGDLKIGDKIRLKELLFIINYSYVLPESKKALKEIAQVLKERDDIYFTIQGHVCCTKNARDAIDKKTRKYNLSVARAKYIYDYFKKQGIDVRRMKYKGMRRMFPLGGDPKYDRRVEIEITYISNNK